MRRSGEGLGFPDSARPAPCSLASGRVSATFPVLPRSPADCSRRAGLFVLLILATFAGSPAAQGRPELAPAARAIRAITGLAVTEVPGGYLGSGERILLTHCDSDAPVAVELLGKAGHAMQVGLRETIRCWEQHRRRDFAGRGTLQVSFENKSLSPDGMSAGAAFAVLLHSFSDQFDVDPLFCMTGDLSVEGRILDVGGVYEKLRGGSKARCTRAAVPSASAIELLDGVILDGPQLLASIEVYGVERLPEVISVARRDRPRVYEQATVAFTTLRGLVDEKVRSGVQAPSARIRSMTTEILASCPNHLSARILDQWNNGSLPKLSIGASITQQDRVLDHYLLKIRTGERTTLADLAHETRPASILQARRALQVLQAKFDPVTVKHGRAMEEVFGEAARFVESLKKIQEAEKAITSAEERIRALKERIRRMSANGAPRQDVDAFIENHNCQVENLAKRVAKRESFHRERQAIYGKVVDHYNEWLRQVRHLVLDPKLRERMTRRSE